MAYRIEVTKDTYEKIALAARMTGSTPGDVVGKIVASASSAVASEIPSPIEDALPVRVQATYEGQRTTGNYYSESKRVEITSGPLAGSSFKTPSSAARAVIESLNPRVNSNRNGWSFWFLTEGGAPLQTIRY